MLRGDTPRAKTAMKICVIKMYLSKVLAYRYDETFDDSYKKKKFIEGGDLNMRFRIRVKFILSPYVIRLCKFYTKQMSPFL